MAVRLITYDLNRETNREGYTGLMKAIKSYTWIKLSESSYAIYTNETVEATYGKLSPNLDDNDNLYVINLSNPHTGFHTQEVHDWLEKYLQ